MKILVRLGSTLALILVLLQLYGASPQNCRGIATLFPALYRIFHCTSSMCFLNFSSDFLVGF